MHGLLDGPIFDQNRPHTKLDEGQVPKGEEDWILQDGTIFCWSESNCHYEYAWWLESDDPSPLVQHLKRTRLPPLH